MTGCQVPLAGFEPASQDPESWGLSISLQGLEAEGAGVEPARAFTRWFSKPLPYRSANPPLRARRGSNPQSQDPQSCALSIVLRALTGTF